MIPWIMISSIHSVSSFTLNDKNTLLFILSRVFIRGSYFTTNGTTFDILAVLVELLNDTLGRRIIHI